MREQLLVPFRIYTAFGNIEVKPCEYLRDEEVLLVDKNGHVHKLIYHGRLIDMPLPPGLEEVEDYLPEDGD